MYTSYLPFFWFILLHLNQARAATSKTPIVVPDTHATIIVTVDCLILSPLITPSCKIENNNIH